MMDYTYTKQYEKRHVTYTYNDCIDLNSFQFYINEYIETEWLVNI